MATDGPDPLPCDPNVYKNGTHVFTTDSISSNRMESWVKQIATMSGQSVDWHFVGGRAVVLALGDIARVTMAIVELMPEHDRLRAESLNRFRNIPL